MKKTRIIALVLCIMMLVGLVTGCKTETVVEDREPVEIVFSFWGNEEEFEATSAVLNTFNEQSDWITVKPLQIGHEEYSAKLKTMATSGGMPDCGMGMEATVIGWARDGLLLEYDMYAGDEFAPLDYLAFRYQGQGDPVAYSAANEVLALWYNREMFDAAGIDYPPTTADTAWTWDEFIEVAKKLTIDANGKYLGEPGFDKKKIVQYGAYINQFTWQLEVWALSNGGKFFSEDGKTVVFDDAAIEAIQKVFDLHLVDGVAPFIDGTKDEGFGSSIGAGNVAMATEGQWAVGFGGDSKIDYGVAVLPYMKKKANICTGGPTVIFATTEHPEACSEFLKWYTSEENSFGIIEAGWWMPIRSNWYDDEELLKSWVFDNKLRQKLDADAYKTAIVDVALDLSITRSTGWYFTPNTSEIFDILRPALVEAISGKKTVKQVVDANRAAMQAALDGD